MDAKEYLTQIRKISMQINEKSEEIAKLKAQIEGGSIPYEKDGTTSGHTDTERNAHMIMRLTELKDDINHQVDMLILAKQRAMALIDMVPDANQMTVLYERYIHLRSWEKISEKLNYSLHYIYRIHNLALDEFNRILKEDTK
ncbi:MAG: DUF1492 domain-containing protein [Absicoccus sp.]|uniref:DUF1492 domain-containing protein n=1 Tax=Absicoccus sp. TaxID=2718527 RepID=UPI002A75C7A5|nr:DUF1492 domain-containing protein [Absicoccus sp.]MDY3034866.1 DUF1492 domain-containing protein [Absicoccus sp.]